LQKQAAQNPNLLGDCLVLIVASAMATKLAWSPGWHWMVLLGMSAGSMLVWTVGGRVLRHYDVWNGRGKWSDVVLTGLLMSAMLVVMALLRAFVPPYAAGSHFLRFIIVAVPAILWLRLTTIWLNRREIPVQPILIVGIGPLGRHTGLEIRDHGDHRRVIGYLRFTDEAVSDRPAPSAMGSRRGPRAAIKKPLVGGMFIPVDKPL